MRFARSWRALDCAWRRTTPAPETGSNAGNLLARIDGPPEARTILLCAHLDTVPLAGPVEVSQRTGC